MQGISLITPTSDRPVAFALCERWMKRSLQHLSRQPVQWIVVDDGHQPVQCHMDQLHIRRPPSRNFTESFRGNLLTALQQVKHDAVLFIEDDDWYAEEYLSRMLTWLKDDVKIVGEARSKYYNIQQRRFHQCRNRQHASLCQTGIHRSLIPWLVHFLSRSSRDVYVDIALWRTGATKLKKHLAPTTSLCIGMKGLPGKSGIGIGHHLTRKRDDDPHGKVLNNWIGTDDAALYWELLVQQQTTPDRSI